jgi:hypothetical protein
MALRLEASSCDSANSKIRSTQQRFATGLIHQHIHSALIRFTPPSIHR